MFYGKVIESSKESLSLDKAQQFIASEKCGASLFFIGTVRNHNNNKNVTGITYDSHDAMVEKSFKEIFEEASEKLTIEHPAVYIEHAKGYIPLGGVSIIIAVAAKHRSQAYDLSRYIIEEIKKRTPIWKKEHYDDNQSDWLKGTPLIDSSS
jgi:molybdopterin synthase catalytic subunit|tara:strand:- start:120 stop:572 length:453 start_codon:yes stop_codon:yes gene_type:complete